jgi:hypothetical protein
VRVSTVWLAWVPPGQGCGALEPSTHRKPGVHGWQAVLPGVDVNVPAGQRLQMDVPCCAAYEPGRHALQAEAAVDWGTGLAVPAGQERHEVFVDDPSTGLYVPAGHGEKVRLRAAAPAMGQKPPRGQAVHSTARKFDEYVAGGQAEHAIAPDVGLYEPGRQGKHPSGSKRP